MGAKMKEMGDSPAGPGMMGGGASAVTKNGLNLYRYIDTNEQVRHMPVGMVVVADDEHLAELLSAFSNSRLRIQVTQCHWQVCRDKMAPLSADSAPATRSLLGDAPARRRPAARPATAFAETGDLSGLVVDRIGKSFGGRQVV